MIKRKSSKKYHLFLIKLLFFPHFSVIHVCDNHLRFTSHFSSLDMSLYVLVSQTVAVHILETILEKIKPLLHVLGILNF